MNSYVNLDFCASVACVSRVSPFLVEIKHKEPEGYIAHT